MADQVMVTTGERQTLLITVTPVLARQQTPGDPALRKVETMADAGVLTYTMPSLPAGGVVMATMNGIEVGATVSGVNVTLQGLSPGEIAATDQLRFFYTE